MANSSAPTVEVFVQLRPASAWISMLRLPVDALRDRLQVPHDDLGGRKDLWRASQPLPWIRFSAGAVYGAEGHLSWSESTLDWIDGRRAGGTVDYEDDFPMILTRKDASDRIKVYYHIHDQDKEVYYPVDSLLVNDRSSLQSSLSAGRQAFVDAVQARDGEVCRATGAPSKMCEAMHLIGHNKGTEYLATFTRLRNRAARHAVDDIDDPRNGILLDSRFHRLLGRECGILRWPNWAMTLPSGRNSRGHLIHTVQGGSDVLGRGPERPDGFGRFGGHLAALRHVQSDPPPRWPSDWPPAYLLDGVYGSAILLTFGSPGITDALKDAFQDSYYPGGGLTPSEREAKLLQKRREDHERKRREDDEARQDCLEKRGDGAGSGGPVVPTLDMLWAMLREEHQDKVESSGYGEDVAAADARLQGSRASISQWAAGVADAAPPTP